MKVKTLRKHLKDLPASMEVFIRCTHNPCGNIVEAGKASQDSYGFFGESIPCVILEPENKDFAKQ